MQIVDERWVGSDTLFVSGFHVHVIPSRFVIRIHRKEHPTQTIEFDSLIQLEGLFGATSMLIESQEPF